MTPAGFQHRLNEARQLLLDQHYAQALSRYAKLTRAFPVQAVVWFEYGIQSEPKHPYVRYACRFQLAQILDRTGRFDEAMQRLDEAKQLVRALTDTELLLKNYDQAAESARQFASSQPKDILRAWAKSFPAPERAVIPPLAFLGGGTSAEWHDVAGTGSGCASGRGGAG